MDFTWVVGFYKGKKAESIRDHANAGIGYFILDQFGKGNGLEIEAGFRRANDSPIPNHLVKASPDVAANLEQMRRSRSGNKH